MMRPDDPPSTSRLPACWIIKLARDEPFRCTGTNCWLNAIYARATTVQTTVTVELSALDASILVQREHYGVRCAFCIVQFFTLHWNSHFYGDSWSGLSIREKEPNILVYLTPYLNMSDVNFSHIQIAVPAYKNCIFVSIRRKLLARFVSCGGCISPLFFCVSQNGFLPRKEKSMWKVSLTREGAIFTRPLSGPWKSCFESASNIELTTTAIEAECLSKRMKAATVVVVAVVARAATTTTNNNIWRSSLFMGIIQNDNDMRVFFGLLSVRPLNIWFSVGRTTKNKNGKHNPPLLV